MFVSYLLALYLNVRFQLYKKTIFPLLLVLSGGCNHLLVLAARWIFLKDEYGMSSRYEIQYQMGIVGILLTFALVWSMCREKAQETEADKAKTRAPEKRAARTPLKVCMLAFTVLTVFGKHGQPGQKSGQRRTGKHIYRYQGSWDGITGRRAMRIWKPIA